MKSLSPFDLTWLLDKKQEIKDKPKHYMIYLLLLIQNIHVIQQ